MTELLDPNDFIITRKRKKYRFAKFHNATNCFEFDEWTRRPVDIVEIGAGTAFFSVELAARYPEKTFVAIDVKGDRLQRGAYDALQRGITNVYFVRARADQVTELFDRHAVAEIWLNFADPFPRPGSARRRMTHPYFLASYQALLAPHGSLHIKHDNPAFFCWSLEQLVATHWTITALSFDLHDTPDEQYLDAKILTSYERRWLDEARITHYVSAKRAEIS